MFHGEKKGLTGPKIKELCPGAMVDFEIDIKKVNWIPKHVEVREIALGAAIW